MGAMKQDLVYEILNELPAGVMLADDSGGIIFANNAAIEYLGIGREGLKEINIDHLLQHGTRKKEIMLRTKGNERVTVNLSKKVLSNGWTVIILNDITEVHQLQQELLKMDKLATVGELTSGIAHEIRNPLAGIKTTAQALSEEIPAQDHRSVYISKIIMEIDRLNKLLLNFFDFAKPKALYIRPFDVKRVIENTIYMIKDTAKANRVQIMEFYPTNTISINADPDMIQQVLMNIFINAVQSMSAGGRMEVHLVEKDSHILIEVSDTGKGIPENIRSRIFDPFFTTKPKGIGLGLSISYRIIKMHSGSITFTSSDAGTKFTVNLSKDIKG
ncbi:MAG: PAS domain-containing protein [Deltaproteobacteria bacterium]|nr:PAS domain-containing protein [Deltaproteobacteria bacterium]